MLKQFVAGVVVAVMLAGTAVAGPLEDGEAAYRSGDYATALKLLKPLAVNGNQKSRFYLGVIYDLGGQGVPRDAILGRMWMSLVAEDSADEGTPRALVWTASGYRVAADLGDAAAQYDLGIMCQKAKECRRTSLRRTCGSTSLRRRATLTPPKTATASPPG